MIATTKWIAIRRAPGKHAGPIPAKVYPDEARGSYRHGVWRPAWFPPGPRTLSPLVRARRHGLRYCWAAACRS
ncbi:hypothetical protein, partial [Mycobacterium sp. shizuoka-1]|uniref:hypothetical protein n=1 Tax=Mycobacterium sp. shizuoka-1 TaxID=2039281 RepID=UPI001E2CE3BB